MAKDYYKILGVTQTANEEEIKKAYRKLAHQYHPDKQGGSADKFKEINEAYQVLGDKQKKENYDRFGTAEPAGGFGGTNWGDFDMGGMGGVNINMGDLNDIFESFFGGAAGGRGRRTVRRGADLELSQEITLEESFHGTVKNLNVRTKITCPICRGAGGDPKEGMSVCEDCNGKGEVREEKRTFFGNFSQLKTCTRCHGVGQIPKKMCGECKGAGRVTGDRKVSLEIIPGVADGQVIQVKNFGEAGERGAPTGDLYVRIRVKPHPDFIRHGDDLIIREELSVTGLLLGKKVKVPTMDGKDIEIEIPAGFDLKQPLRVTGKGMPKPGHFGRGDILVDFILKAPKKLSGKEKKALEDLGLE